MRLHFGRWLVTGRPRVLLIDELDQSDIDLPQQLRTVFDDGGGSLVARAFDAKYLHLKDYNIARFLYYGGKMVWKGVR